MVAEHPSLFPGKKDEIMNDTDTVRILIADDHLMVRKGLSTLIQGVSDFTLVGEAEDGEQAVLMCHDLRPDVILMDLVMPEVNGIEAIRRIHAESPSVNIIALTSFPDPQLIKQALEAGARGFLYKDVGADELINAIHQVNVGQAVLDSDVLNILMNKFENLQKKELHDRHGEVKLSPREKDVLNLLVKGKSTKQMAVILHIQPSTIKQALSSLYQKLGANNRTEAVSIALREKIYTG
jgi:DNA-binding NarL/FixJ family response regulator